MRLVTRHKAKSTPATFHLMRECRLLYISSDKSADVIKKAAERNGGGGGGVRKKRAAGKQHTPLTSERDVCALER
jgi:hypothetical protein